MSETNDELLDTSGHVTTPFRQHRAPRYVEDAPIADLAASFQAAVVEPLAVKAATAAAEFGARTVILAGGVAANALLRHRLQQEVGGLCPPETVVLCPPLAYCTDNAAMVAAAAAWSIRRGDQTGLEADVFPRLPIVQDS
jgi:N6-L-threonylcarbamoyladenine synthase